MKLKYQSNFIYSNRNMPGNSLVFIYLSKENRTSILWPKTSFYTMDIINEYMTIIGLTKPRKEFSLKKIG